MTSLQLCGSYTHYWSVCDRSAFETAWPQIVIDAQLIVAKAGVALNRTGEDETPPTLTEGSIMLNGTPEDDHEPFDLDQTGGELGFCKTAEKEYDVVVTAILLRASQIADKAVSVRYVDFSICSRPTECSLRDPGSSEGYWDERKPA